MLSKVLLFCVSSLLLTSFLLSLAVCLMPLAQDKSRYYQALALKDVSRSTALSTSVDLKRAEARLIQSVGAYPYDAVSWVHLSIINKVMGDVEVDVLPGMSRSERYLRIARNLQPMQRDVMETYIQNNVVALQERTQ